ncbi:penicillin-binding transpeptidase domain-containing protein, partial [Neobacillus drentensis]
MAGAYSAFGNKGNYNKPHFVQKVVLPDAKVVHFTEKPKRVMHDYTAYMVTDMLRSVVTNGGGAMANVPGLYVVGKTGTTNFDPQTRAKFGYPDNATNDSWFVGYSPQYTMAVWTGYAQNGSGNFMSATTTPIAKYMFKAMMQSFGTDSSSFQQPNSVYRVNNELYIRGINSAEVPPKPKPIINKAKPANNNAMKPNKEEKKQQKEQKKKHQGKGKGKGKKNH